MVRETPPGTPNRAVLYAIFGGTAAAIVLLLLIHHTGKW